MTRFLSLAAVALAAAPLGAADAPTPVLGIGIVSADHKAVFLPAKGGGVEAIDLATGNVLWTNTDAAKLAGASDKTVFAWADDAKAANAFRVVAIDAATGKTSGKSDPITLPDWATTATGHGHTFRTAVKPDAGGATVAWEARAFYFGGAAPTQEILDAAKKDAGGLAKVDFKTGKVTPANGKPKAEDFTAGPAGAFGNTAGDYQFQMSEQLPGFKPGAAMVTTVTFTALKGKNELWKRELAGNPWSPPPP